MNHKVIGIVYSSNCFTYNKSFKFFSTTITQCPAVLRQLFADEMELGFGIYSEKTGNTAYFTLKAVDRNTDDEIVSFTFVPHEQTLESQPRLKDISVIIVKDVI